MIFYARVIQNANQGWLDPQLLDSAEDVNALIDTAEDVKYQSKYLETTTMDGDQGCYIELPNARFVYNLSQPSSNRTEALTICGNSVLGVACDGGETDVDSKL